MAIDFSFSFFFNVINELISNKITHSKTYKQCRVLALIVKLGMLGLEMFLLLMFSNTFDLAKKNC